MFHMHEKMSEDVVPVNFQHFFCEAYHGEWKLTNLLNHKNKKLISPSFRPLDFLDVKFHFEIWFLEYPNQNNSYTLLKFVLFKLDGSTVPESLKMEIEMKVEYSDGTLLKEYRNMPALVVNDMDTYYFDEIRSRFQGISYSGDHYFDDHGKRMKNNEPIHFKCSLKFFVPLDESPINHSMLPSVSCLKTLKNSSDDIKSFRRSDEFSDVIIRTGSRLFFAHRAVLSNHSSVFKQMLTQKQDKETVLDIGNELCDVFDNFLDFVYSGDFKCTSWPKLRELYVLSSKYEVDALKEKCAAAVVSHLSIDKVCEILKMACDYEDSSLKDVTTKFAVEHIRDIIFSNEWKEFVVSHPLVGHEITLNFLNI